MNHPKIAENIYQIPKPILHLNAGLAAVEQFPGDLDAHGVDAGVVNVVRLIEDDAGVPRQVLAHDLGDLGVQEVVVAVHHHLCLPNRPSCEEIRAPALAATVLSQILDRTHTD